MPPFVHFSPRSSVFVVAALCATPSLFSLASAQVAVQPPPAIQPPVDAPPSAKVPTPPTQPVLITGIVRDANGKPVSGATVLVQRLFQDSVTVKTDTEGRYTLKTDSLIMRGGLSSLTLAAYEKLVRVYIFAPGLALTQQDLRVVMLDQNPENKPASVNETTLQPGCAITAQLLDEGGKPLAHFSLLFSSLHKAGSNFGQDMLELYDIQKEESLTSLFHVSTDDQGRFTLRGLPAGEIGLGSQNRDYETNAPRVTLNQETTRDSAQGKVSATITFSRLSDVKGRVLFPDGKPAANITVVARAGEGDITYNEGKTDAEGKYTLAHIKAGPVQIRAAAPSAEWSPTETQPFTAISGQTLQAPDLVVSKGTVITGYVLEQGTFDPVAGARVGISINSHSYTRGQDGYLAMASARTDAQGRYTLRIQEGSQLNYFVEPPAGYIQDPFDVDRGHRVGKDAHNFFVQRALNLAGTAVDETGKPATGATIRMSTGKSARVDDQGKWALNDINPNYNRNEEPAKGVRLRVEGDWEFVGKPVFTESSANIVLTLRHVALQDVKVRVVTPQGQSVSGVTIRGIVYENEASTGGNGFETLSDDHGELTVRKLRSGQVVSFAPYKKGYLLLQPGSISRFGALKTGEEANAGVLSAQDIVMTPLSAQVRGRVVDAQGNPVAGARLDLVTPGDLRDTPDSGTLSDKEGKFTLLNLPDGEVVIGVACGRAYTQLKVKTGQPLTVTLPEAEVYLPHDVAEVFARVEVWTDRARDLKQLNYYGTSLSASLLASYDAARAMRMMTGADGKIEPYFLATAPLLAARHDPQKGLALSKLMLPLIEDEKKRTDAALKIAVFTARVDPVGARQLYDLVAATPPPPELTNETAGRVVELAALAGALHLPEQDGWLQLLALNAEDKGESGAFVVSLAEGDREMARRWIEQLPPISRIVALGAFIRWLTRSDLPSAQRELTGMEALLQRPEFQVTPTPQNVNLYFFQSAVHTARNAVAQALLKIGQFQKAQETIRQEKGTTYPLEEMLLHEARLRLKIAQGQNDISAELFDPRINQDTQEGAHNVAYLATLANDKLPAASANALHEARVQLAAGADKVYPGFDHREEITGYASALRAVDPAVSRLLLENAWQRLMQSAKNARQAPKPGQRFASFDGYEFTDKARAIMAAMVPLSIERADTMLQEALTITPEAANAQNDIQRLMVNWLLSDENQRRTPDNGERWDWHDPAAFFTAW